MDKYIVLVKQGTAGLEKAVEKYLEAGYKPQGGVAFHIVDETGRAIFAQAMVLEDEE